MKRILVPVGVVGLALAASACGSSAPTSTPGTWTGTSSRASSSPSSRAAAGMSAPVGPGCAADPANVPSGPGSVEDIADEPVAVAASHHPLLKDFVAAASGKLNPEVDLVGTLDGGQFTLFAPVDSAFAQVPAATLARFRADAGLLTKILTYHLLPVQVAPDKIVGSHRTVEGSTVTVAGTPGNLTVDGVKVVCGGLHAANATIYLIDGVLTPTT